MGWPVLSLGNDFYALVMGIWCRIVGVCECVFVGRGAVREAFWFSEKLTRFNAKMPTLVVLLIIS